MNGTEDHDIVKLFSKAITKVLKQDNFKYDKENLRGKVTEILQSEISNVDKKKRKQFFKSALKQLVDLSKVIISETDGLKYYFYKKSKKRKFDSTASNDNKSTIVEESLPEITPLIKTTTFVEDVENKSGDTTILLFYAYCNPVMSRISQDEAINHCYNILNGLKITGRLRIAREGYNCTLTGTYVTIRKFTDELKRFDPLTFKNVDFKYVDYLPENQKLKGLKVFPCTEIVTYGFNAVDAPLNKRGIHLKPHDFHKALENPNSVVIDVRNFNETIIGKFAPPPVKVDGNKLIDKVLDPCMRRSTEFPNWVEENREKLEGKQVLMYCTAGVRCERASAFLKNKGIENVYQLEGGIHRYLEAFPEDGGYWIGKNYTFDKRFSHGPKKTETISNCVYCKEPWDRYQAQRKCCRCSMEVLLCKTCQRKQPKIPNNELICPLCNI